MAIAARTSTEQSLVPMQAVANEDVATTLARAALSF